MKRRNFFGAFAGLIAAPVAASVIKKETEKPVEASAVKEVIVEKNNYTGGGTAVTCCTAFFDEGFPQSWDAPGRSFDEDDEDDE
jgi:hypothetical protein